MTASRGKLPEIHHVYTSVEVANKERIEVFEAENATLELSMNNGGNTYFERCFICSRPRRKLLSVGRIEELGMKVTFQNEKAIVSAEDGSVIFTAHIHERLYSIEKVQSCAR